MSSYGIYKGLRVVAIGAYYEAPKHQLPKYSSSVCLTHTKYYPEEYKKYLDILALTFNEQGPINRLEFGFRRYKDRLGYRFNSILRRFKRLLVQRIRLRRLVHKAKFQRIVPELIAAAWHPRRVEKWLEDGVQLEDL
jgi:hypothetical protein